MRKNKYTIVSLLLFFMLLLGISGFCHAMGNFSFQPPTTETSFSGLFRNLLVNIQGIVGWLAVIIIFVGGIVYITAGGSVRQVTLAKSIIIYALVGFAIAVAAPSLLREISDIAINGVGGGPDLIINATPVGVIVARVMNFLLTLIGMLSLIGFVWGGIKYLVAGGDFDKAKVAKRTIIYTMIAICVSGASIIIIRQIIQILETS